MAFPTYKEIEIPLLLYVFRKGGEVKSSSCYEPLAKEFNLTEEEQLLPLENGNGAKWNNMVQWARKSLVDENYLFNAKEYKNGTWKLTELGVEKAEALFSKVNNIYPDDVSDSFFEGAVKLVSVNKYERSQAARDKCIDCYGLQCSVCDVDFEKIYGEIGKDFIHVHHITPISEIGRIYELDPVRDLRPVCPNCHSMLHRETPPITISELKKKMKNQIKLITE